ncbi:Asp-tRNA(Asn)/Glu-tRNA(Gln) amidotransferase subunit GatA [Candidatus Micrarchaeota archaeon]|nr:Asp-tRNA(Asn)/Glu-tRNA(Gln) amidotransferase subunit GatA [Candidatus Micrarchaeota archaeon]
MDALKKIIEADEKFNCCTYVPKEIEGSGKKLVSAKDNLCVKGMPAQAGSKILEGYVPPFDATVVERAKKAGYAVCAKTVMDEFGFGTFNVNTYKVPKNPHDPTRATGGSSGGSACLVAATGIPSIAESTGGSITAPSAFCGVVGVTPTYGLVSRYGLIDYANSLDKIGTMATTVTEAFSLLDTIKGTDKKDSTSTQPAQEKKLKNKIALPKEIWERTDERTRKQCWKAIDAMGVEAEEVSLKHVDSALYSYYIIAMAEASTNLAKYCGLRYGLQNEYGPEETYTEYFTKTRNAFGEEAKRRLLLGSFARTSGYRGKYYEKACKVRTLVIGELKNHLKEYDGFLTPSMPAIAPKFSEIAKLSPLQHYRMDVCTVPFNLAGLPHASVPFGKVDGMPVGVQIIGDHFQEKTVEKYAKIIEERK